MPLPFIAGAAVVAAGLAGAAGIGGHMLAKEKNEQADKIAQDAERIYNEAKKSLEEIQETTETSLLILGESKEEVLNSSMARFFKFYSKIKEIKVKNSEGLDELTNFSIDQEGVLELQELQNLYQKSLSKVADNVGKGAKGVIAITFATNTFTAGLVATSVSPLAILAVPALLVSGLSADSTADENLEKANVMYAEAEASVAKMKNAEIMCQAIGERADMFDDLLGELDMMFSRCTILLESVVNKKLGFLSFFKKLKADDFTEEELKLIAVTRALAGAIKSVIDTPILDTDGEMSYEFDDVYDDTQEALPQLTSAVEEVTG